MSRVARKPSERGAALLTALILISVLAVVAVAVQDDILFAVKRTTNIRLHDQALWHAKSAEALGRQVIHRGWQAQPGRATLADPWARQDVRFPIDGGSVGGRIRDGGNCFNLNSVVERDARGRFVARPLGLEQFQRLAEAVGFNASDAESLGATLADWIDSDGAARPGGAEDSDYMRMAPPYRTASTLIADVTELRAMHGFSPKIYAALRPFVCVLPNETLSVLNVNTLQPNDAPLIVMVGAAGLSLSAARRAIDGRPLSGYVTPEAFWAMAPLAPYKPSIDLPRQTAVTTRYFMLETDVAYYTAEVATQTLVHLDEAGRTSIIGRRIGVFE
jgi:general secretion pathway protein K